MAADAHRGLAAYVAAVAAGTPAPGGGSVAAVTGALAASLGEMVANLTTGRDLPPEHEAELQAACMKLTELRSELLALAAADEAAYAGYRHAAAMPRTTDAERIARKAAMQTALIAATDVPLAVARATTTTASLLGTIAMRGNPHLHPDAALGALLSQSALRGALLNVRGNAALLKDEARAEVYREAADALEASGIAHAETAYAAATSATRSSGGH